MKIELNVMCLSAGNMKPDDGEAFDYASLRVLTDDHIFEDEGKSSMNWGLKPAKMRIVSDNDNAVSKRLMAYLKDKRAPLTMSFDARQIVKGGEVSLEINDFYIDNKLSSAKPVANV